MKYLEQKWLHKEITLLPEVESYIRYSHLLIRRVQPKHRLDADMLRGQIHNILQMIYLGIRRGMLARRKEFDETHEKRIVHNCSISQLRREHQRALQKLEERFTQLGMRGLKSA